MGPAVAPAPVLRHLLMRPLPPWPSGLLLRAEAAPFIRLYTKNLTTISGHLVRRRRDCLVLRNASVAWNGQLGGERPLTGEVHVPREQVDLYVLS